MNNLLFKLASIFVVSETLYCQLYTLNYDIYENWKMSLSKIQKLVHLPRTFVRWNLILNYLNLFDEQVKKTVTLWGKIKFLSYEKPLISLTPFVSIHWLRGEIQSKTLIWK